MVDCKNCEEHQSTREGEEIVKAKCQKGYYELVGVEIKNSDYPYSPRNFPCKGEGFAYHVRV